jgi:digeranylgeranylglycerophospholipid reductase
MIAVIGAGPVGNYVAYLLSKKYKVCVFEEHNKIGIPIQCAGIVTESLKEIIKLKKQVIVNEINTAKIFAPNKKFIKVNLAKKDIIINRYKFDNQLTDMAKKNGVKFYLNHKYISNNKSTIIIKDIKKNIIKKFKYDYLIGADGPNSNVSKQNNLYQNRKYWIGAQARVRIKNDNSVEFYPFFGSYAWLIPENKNIARVGIVTSKNTSILFKEFLFKFKKIKQKDIIEYQGGLIPKYNPRMKTQNNNVFIVGDAACQIKATTGGGIVQGLIACNALYNSIVFNKNYKRECKKLLGKELYIHLKARNIMDKFKDSDWNKLVNSINNSKGILEKNNRDNISKLIFKLLIKQPDLFYFLKYLF